MDDKLMNKLALGYCSTRWIDGLPVRIYNSDYTREESSITCVHYFTRVYKRAYTYEGRAVPMGLWSSAALAFAVTVALTLTLRPLALRIHFTDRPGGRKRHLGEIPLVGGIAMFIGILVAAMAAVHSVGRWTLLVPASLLVIAGIVDD